MTKEDAIVLIDKAMAEGYVLREDWAMVWRPMTRRLASGQVEDISHMEIRGLVPPMVRRQLVELGVNVGTEQIDGLMQSLGFQRWSPVEGALGYTMELPNGDYFSIHDYEGTYIPLGLDEEAQAVHFLNEADHGAGYYEDYSSLNELLDELLGLDVVATGVREYMGESRWMHGLNFPDRQANPRAKRRLLR